MIGVLIGWRLSKPAGWNLPAPAGSNVPAPLVWIWDHFDPIIVAAIFLISAALIIRPLIPPGIRPAVLSLVVVLFGIVEISFYGWSTPADAMITYVGPGRAAALRGTV